MTTIDKIRKRIQTMQMLKNEDIKEIKISKQESKQLGDIKSIDNVRLIIEGEIKYSAKTDCFAYVNRNGYKSCYCLDKLYCEKEDCNFYNPNIKIEDLVKSAKKYSSGKGEI